MRPGRMGGCPRTDADAVLAALDPEQRAVAEALSGPVCVLAGAGTGKTRAITHRIAYGVHAGVYTPQRVLAVTFTARAAGEMRGRLRALGVGGVQARTFHAAALRQLRYFWPRVVGGEVPRITDRKVPILAEAAGRLRLAPGPTGLRDLAAEIEWAKVTRTAPEDYPAAATRAGRTPPLDLDAATMGRVFAGYEEAKRGKGLIDFEDVLLLTVAALEERRDVARGGPRRLPALRRRRVPGRQPAAAAAPRAVARRPRRPLRRRRREPDHLLLHRGVPQLPARLPAPLARRRGRTLVRDYRSTPQVVALANRLLAAAHGRRGRGSARAGRAAARPARSRSSRGTPTSPPRRPRWPREVRALLDAGVPAVGDRRPVPHQRPVRGLRGRADRALGIPYVLRGGERFFERPEVKEAVLLLRGAARASEATAGGLPAEVGDVLAAAGWDPAAPPTGGAARERWESLAALVRLTEDFAATRPAATLRELVGELDERALAQHAPTVEGVTLASLHAAKGLEWDAVFLVGLVDGMVPIVHAQTATAVEEERRLLYVGVTRAREHLSLSWSWARNPGGARTRKPSRFLDGLRPVDRATAPAAGRAGASKRSGRGRGRLEEHCHLCRAQLVTAAQRKRGRCDDCPPDYDEAFYDLLRSWRLERARADSVPAYVVFTDATLEAIAVRRPSSRAELSAISGVGATKLERYSDAVIALVSGASVEVALAAASDPSP